MISGFETALGEITLVLFTTLAPSGALAVLIMGLPVLLGWADGAESRRISKYLCVPLVVSMVGLIASATHLGNPANALYVFSAVGQSPLSNEVLCAVVFLALTGVYWLYSFSERPNAVLQRLWLAAIGLSAVVFIVAVGFAYAARTILSWNTIYVPLGVAFNALAGGPLLALASLAAAGCWPMVKHRGRVLALVSGVAAVANTAVYALQGIELTGMRNSLVTASDLVPGYAASLAAFVVLMAAALVLTLRGLRALGVGRQRGNAPIDGEQPMNTSADRVSPSDGRAPGLPSSRLAGAWPFYVAAALALVAIFIMRFCFYMSHMTVGLGV